MLASHRIRGARTRHPGRHRLDKVVAPNRMARPLTGIAQSTPWRLRSAFRWLCFSGQRVAQLYAGAALSILVDEDNAGRLEGALDSQQRLHSAAQFIQLVLSIRFRVASPIQHESASSVWLIPISPALREFGWEQSLNTCTVTSLGLDHFRCFVIQKSMKQHFGACDAHAYMTNDQVRSELSRHTFSRPAPSRDSRPRPGDPRRHAGRTHQPQGDVSGSHPVGARR